MHKVLAEIYRADAVIALLDPSSNRDECELQILRACVANIKMMYGSTEDVKT